MNIAFIVSDINNGAGIERVTSNLSNEFVKRDEVVTVISLFKTRSTPYFNFNKNIKIFYLTNKAYSAQLSKFERLKLIKLAFDKLKKFLKNNSYNLIISQAFLPTFLLYFLRNLVKSPIIICEHFKYELYGKILTKIRNRIYKKIGKVVTLTINDEKKFKNVGIDAVTIGNMISFPIQPHPFRGKRMIAVGRLHPQKGFDILIPAMIPVFNNYPDWKLDIYGEGHEKQNLENLISNNGLQSNIFIKNYTSNIQEELLKSDIFILSSRYEGFPMIIVEALALGVPVVSFDCPEGPSTLLRDEGGILVKAENKVELSEAIIKMIQSEDKRESCRRQGYVNIQKFTPDFIIKEWYSLFESLNVVS